MRNTVILFALIFVAAAAGAGFITEVERRVRPTTELPQSEPVNFERMAFWDITVDEIIAEDPEGWQALVDDENTTPEQIEAWQMEVRQQLFERKYGHRYDLNLED